MPTYMVDTCIFFSKTNLNNQSNILIYYMSPCIFILFSNQTVYFFTEVIFLWSLKEVTK